MLKFQNLEVYLACGATDMRKSINALSVIVEQSFHLDPFSPALFVFCGRNRDCLKILEWDGDGFWLHLKRLEAGRFQWPAHGEDSTLKLSRDELVYLLENTKLKKKLLRKEVKPGRVA